MGRLSSIQHDDAIILRPPSFLPATTLDDPFLTRFFSYLGDLVLRFDFGTSVLNDEPVRPLVFEALPTDDPQVRRPDITRARELLGWEPSVDLREGLRRTLDGSSREQLVGSPR